MKCRALGRARKTTFFVSGGWGTPRNLVGPRVGPNLSSSTILLRGFPVAQNGLLRVDLNLWTVFSRKPDFKFFIGFHNIIVPVSRNIWANPGNWSWKVWCGSEMFGTAPFGEAERDQV